MAGNFIDLPQHDGDDNHDYDVDGDGGSHDDVDDVDGNDDVDGDDDVDEDGREFHRSPGQQLELDFPLFRVASIDWADAHGD